MGEKQRKAIKAISELAENASKWLGIKRSDPWSSMSMINGL